MKQHWSHPMSDQPFARGRSFVRPGLLLVTGALALTVAACSTSTPTAAGPTTTTPAAQQNARGAQTPPGAFGTAAAVSATSLEVQSRQDGQVTVKFNGSTKFTNTIKASLTDVKTGECVVVTARSGGAQATKLTARTVQITTAGSAGCTAAGFGGGGFGGGGGFAGRGGSRTPDPSHQPRPSGANRPGADFGRAFGTVTAVSGPGFTVKGVARGSTPAVTTAVTVNASTTYTKTAGASSSALTVGDCVAALGPADDTGAVTAKTIAVSKPGNDGCEGGFGGGAGAGAGRGGFRGNGNGGNEGGGPAPSQAPGSGNG
jgi:hypothetical protein